jgi:hypothetical protein
MEKLPVMQHLGPDSAIDAISHVFDELAVNERRDRLGRWFGRNPQGGGNGFSGARGRSLRIGRAGWIRDHHQKAGQDQVSWGIHVVVLWLAGGGWGGTERALGIDGRPASRLH